jgi:hypothetical protein
MAAVEIQLSVGHPDVQGLGRALSDWSAELRLIQQEFGDQPNATE